MNVTRFDYCDSPTSSGFSVGNNNFYFSYRTCIAFQARGKLYCSENVWSVTTGKHLNCIQPDKERRLKSEEFANLLASLNMP